MEANPSMNLFKHFDPRKDVDEGWKIVLKDELQKTEYSNEFVMSIWYSLFKDLIKFSESNTFSIYQKCSLFEIFYSCLNYFKLVPILTSEQLSKYFYETLLLYTVEDPPKSLRVFSLLECFAIAKLYNELFETNFNLMKHALCTNFVVEIEIASNINANSEQ